MEIMFQNVAKIAAIVHCMEADAGDHRSGRENSARGQTNAEIPTPTFFAALNVTL
jgi:hypothetical protein